MGRYFLVAYSAIPMLLAPVILVVFQYYDTLPEWYYQTSLNYWQLLIILLSVLTVQIWLWTLLNLNTKVFVCDYSHSQRIIFLFVGFLFGKISGINFREYADQNGFNILYSFISILCLTLFFSRFTNRTVNVVLFFIIGIICGVNGSKAALLVFLVFIIFTSKKVMSLGKIILAIVILFIIFINAPHYILRFIDPGLSMLTVASICTDSGISTINLYFEAIINKMNGESFNPGFAFFERSNISSGFNVTPTVIGDIYCTGVLYPIAILIYSVTIYVLYVLPANIFRYNYYQRVVLYFYSTIILTSTVFDVVKFAVLVHAALLLHKLFVIVSRRAFSVV